MPGPEGDLDEVRVSRGGRKWVAIAGSAPDDQASVTRDCGHRAIAGADVGETGARGGTADLAGMIRSPRGDAAVGAQRQGVPGVRLDRDEVIAGGHIAEETLAGVAPNDEGSLCAKGGREGDRKKDSRGAAGCRADRDHGGWVFRFAGSRSQGESVDGSEGRVGDPDPALDTPLHPVTSGSHHRISDKLGCSRAEPASLGGRRSEACSVEARSSEGGPAGAGPPN